MYLPFLHVRDVRSFLFVHPPPRLATRAEPQPLDDQVAVEPQLFLLGQPLPVLELVLVLSLPSGIDEGKLELLRSVRDAASLVPWDVLLLRTVPVNPP